MEQTFRNQTTKLVTAFPFKGTGVVNDRLRLDVSGLAANTEYVLSYDTTNGTFAWSTPEDVSGLDTLYTSDGTIEAERVVTLDTDTSLTIADADLSNRFHFVPGTNGIWDIVNTDYFREGSDANFDFLLGDGLIRLRLLKDGASVEADPEDSEIYYVSDREAQFIMDHTQTEWYILEVGGVNGDLLDTKSGIDLTLNTALLYNNKLADYSNAENTFLHKEIGDGDDFGISRYYPTTTQYVTNNSLADGALIITDSLLSIYHTRYGASSSEILLTSTHTDVGEMILRLNPDIIEPVLRRTDIVTGVNTHQLSFDSAGVEIVARATDDTVGPYIYLQANNGSADTSLELFQQDVDEEESGSYFSVKVNNVDGSRSVNFDILEDFARMSASGTPSTAAILELNSTVQGFLPPRMTEAERDLIALPMAGLMIYNTTTNKLNVYTTAWEAITSA